MNAAKNQSGESYVQAIAGGFSGIWVAGNVLAVKDDTAREREGGRREQKY